MKIDHLFDVLFLFFSHFFMFIIFFPSITNMFLYKIQAKKISANPSSFGLGTKREIIFINDFRNYRGICGKISS